MCVAAITKTNETSTSIREALVVLQPMKITATALLFCLLVRHAACLHPMVAAVTPGPPGVVIQTKTRGPAIRDQPRFGDFHHRPVPSIFPVSGKHPSSMLLARRGTAGEVDLGSLLDDVAPSSQVTETDRRAAALSEQKAQEEQMKAVRAQVAITRMDEAAAAKAREAELVNSRIEDGLQPCEDSVWGGSGQTGLLSAKACARLRDGLLENGRGRTGFFVVF